MAVRRVEVLRAYDMSMGNSGSHLYTERWIQILEAEQRGATACCHKAQERLLLVWCETFQGLRIAKLSRTVRGNPHAPALLEPGSG